MLHHKKQFKNKLFACIVIAVFLISSFSIFNFQGANIKNNINEENNGTNLLNTSSDIDIPFSGVGDDQEGRLYYENRSVSLNNNNGEFNITAPKQNTYLNYGDMFFEFEENYVANHTIEDDNALSINPDKLIYFSCTEDGSELNVDHGISYGTFENQFYGYNNDTKMRITTSDGIINFTIKANFSGTFFRAPSNEYGRVNFQIEKILGFLMDFTYNLTADADLTISILRRDNSWKNIHGPITLSSGASKERTRLSKRIINENLNLVNDTNDCTYINFYLNSGTSDYEIELYEFTFNATYAFEIPIDINEPIALEFDIRGNNTIVNGFYAWIRTIDIPLAATTELKISIYKSDIIIENRGNIPNFDEAIPETAELAYSTVLLNYNKDGVNYFEFNTIETLDYYNYFIIIEANNSDVYRLITIDRRTDYGDNEYDHLLKRYDFGDSAWQLAEIQSIGNGPVGSGSLDASSFKLNVTRGYMPSDFKINGNETLVIKGIPLEDTSDKNFKYRFSTNHYMNQWGVGLWNNSIIDPFSNGLNPDFQIDLIWNTTITNDFYFNVSYYVKAYERYDTSVTYSVNYDELPLWTITFNVIFEIALWNFTELWFIYPYYFDSSHLITPLSTPDNVISETNGEEPLNNNYDKLILSYNMTEEQNGDYILKARSFNAVNKIYSYLNYNDNIWESQGFMHGDNMSIGVDIGGPDYLGPHDGYANATLYYPDESVYLNIEDFSGTLSDNFKQLYYEFDDQILLNIDETIPVYGTYKLGIFWNNGSSIGCRTLPIYIDQYDVSFGILEYDREDDQNLLSVSKIAKEAEPIESQYYNLYIGSINKTMDFPSNFYAINNSNINIEYTYEVSGYDLNVELRNFLQNETIINPEEQISFNITLENKDPYIDLDMKVSVDLVSLMNEEWIIASDISEVKQLSQAGDPNGDYIKDFTVELDIPTLEANGFWPGVNAPIRLGGAKAIVTIYIEDEAIGTYDCPDNALLVDQTESEFEGYIISLKSSILSSAKAMHKVFQREDCTYLPDNTTFIANIVDTHYISSYSPFLSSYQLKAKGIFQNIAITPESFMNGNEFNISSLLTTEFDKVLPGESVTCQYNDSGIWVDISDSPQITDSKGYSLFEIDTSVLGIEEDKITLKLIWNGSSIYLKNTEEITIDFFSLVDEITVNAVILDSVIYRNKDSYLQVRLTNTGTSNLNISDISLIFTGINPKYQIVAQDILVLENLKSGQTTRLILEIKFKDIPTNTLTFNITVEGKNIETEVNYSISINIKADVLDRSIIEDIKNQIMILIISIIALIWVASLYYSYRLKKRIERPIEKPEKKRPRKGRYVKVSEIPQPEEEEKVPEKKKTTDLDSLLEEEGLED